MSLARQLPTWSKAKHLKKSEKRLTLRMILLPVKRNRFARKTSGVKKSKRHNDNGNRLFFSVDLFPDFLNCSSSFCIIKIEAVHYFTVLGEVVDAVDSPLIRNTLKNNKNSWWLWIPKNVGESFVDSLCEDHQKKNWFSELNENETPKYF